MRFLRSRIERSPQELCSPPVSQDLTVRQADVCSQCIRGEKGTWQLTSVCQTRHTIVQVQITV